MMPSYNGFTGTVTLTGESKWSVSGVIRFDNPTTATVTEVPPSVSFDSFEEKAKKAGFTVDNLCTDTQCRFVIKKETAFEAKDVPCICATVSTSNMYLFNDRGIITKYDTITTLLKEWCVWRLGVYDKRRTHVLASFEHECAVLAAKVAFVNAVVTKKIDFEKETTDTLVAKFESRQFVRHDGSYEYLLGMAARSFTTDNVEKLKKKADEVKAAWEAYKQETPETLWRKDLTSFAAAAASA